MAAIALMAVGALIVVVGTALIYPLAAVIVAGAFVFLLGVDLARPDTRAPASLPGGSSE